jgi:hypothetical protein
MEIVWLIVGVAVALLGVLVVGFVWSARGVLTLDTGWARSMHPLGPITVLIDAPREVVFEQISGVYLGRTPAELRRKLEVLERGTDMVLAAHRTRTGRITSVTVETVRFSPPDEVSFRHVRGPAPYAVERFLLTEAASRTELRYEGEIGFDLGLLGRLWARRVVPIWDGVVARSLEEIKEGAERRAIAHERRGHSTSEGDPGRVP